MKYKLASNDEIRFCCPFCERVGKPPDTKFHLYVSMRTGDWICFRCNARGRNLKGLPKDMANIVIEEGIKRGIAFTPRPEKSQEQRLEIDFELTEIHDFGEKHYNSNHALKYIINRFSRHLGMWNIGEVLRSIPSGYVYLTNDQRKVVFLSRKYTGEVDYYVTRNIEGEVKYQNPHSSPPLFKVGWWEINKVPPAFIIVEGVMDALVTYIRQRIPTVALLGKTLRSSQQQELSLYVDKVSDIVIALDKDAQREACMIGKQLRASYPIKVYRAVSMKEDPAESGGVFQRLLDIESDLECALTSIRGDKPHRKRRRLEK